MHIPHLPSLPFLKKFANPLAVLIALALVSTACGDVSLQELYQDLIQDLYSTPVQAPATAGVVLETEEPTLAAEVSFRVTLPESAPDDSVYLNVLEEVTGLALSAQSYRMEREDDTHYKLSLPFAIGSVVKYRYTRFDSEVPVVEHVSDGRQVRYRLLHVQGPGQVEDVVARWTDTEFSGQSGRISGQAVDAESGEPVPNLLAAAGGVQALTASDGSFLLEGLLPGTHNLVLYALDGSYRTFQQGARVDALATTPAQISLSRAPIVNQVFVLSVPGNTIPAVPIRFAGNLHQLGNTFADLSGGVSTLASLMPTLSILPDGRYTITLALPAGADIRYLYTLGDGLWNTEKTAAGNTRIRQLIVPEGSTQIDDEVETWNVPNTPPITFDVTVPAGTPAEDFVSIQFNPLFGWTEPIPMWRLEENRWAYVLNSPPGRVGEFHYRFCRNDQCGAADDSQSAGPANPGFPITPGRLPQSIVDTVDAWAWLDPSAGAAEVTTPPVAVRGSSFMAGVEFQPVFHPSWTKRIPNSLDAIQSTGANWLVLTPTWTFTRSSPPVLEPVTGLDPLWMDLADEIRQSQERGLNAAIFPTPHLPLPADGWWRDAPRDFPWWVAWFERYQGFILHHADLAAGSGAQALILGGDWLGPALPGGTLDDGSPSGVPDDAEDRWRELIQQVRARYSGPVLWALPYALAADAPAFLDSVDQIYLLFSEPIASQPNPTQAELEAESARIIDSGLLPLQSGFNKPIVLAAGYPSVDGAATACLADENGGCLSPGLFNRPGPDFPAFNLDLQEQADIYNALLVAVNQRTWISGLIARGYYPPAALQDKSFSIHGKPAQDVLAYWFPQLLGNTTP